MSIEDRLNLVKLAEVDAEAARVRAHDAIEKLRRDARAAATPWRIVTVGAAVGFMMGRSAGGAPGAPSVGGRIFASIAQALITTLGAGATAGAAASSAAGAAAGAAADATAKATTLPPEETVTEP